MLVATSVGVTVRTLMNLNTLDTNSGVTILGAAVYDDVIGIILLAFLLGTGSLTNLITLTINLVIYFLIFCLLGLKIMDKILNLGDKIKLPHSLISISLAIVLIYAFFAAQCGITTIIGGFIAGLLIGNTVIGEKKVVENMKVIGEAFFIPLFFVWVGATVDLTVFLSVGIFAIVIIIIAITGKIIGCGIGAKIGGMTNYESLYVGVGMIPRLEMALITVLIAVNHNILSGDEADKIKAVTIIVCVVTAIVTPLMIKAITKKE
jgi:Kef-type K+ transport system membrane component KefB